MAVVCPAQMGSLRAGAARVDISPPKEMFPLQNTLLFGGLHDPIYARALVLDNGKTKVAIVGLDLLDLMVDNGLIRDISNELKIPVDNVVLNVPHDNSSLLISNSLPNSVMSDPNQDIPAFTKMRKGVIEAVREANANLQPARVGFGTGKAYVNASVNGADGPSDKTVAVLEVTKPTGEPIAIYTSYAVHSLVMYQSVMDNGQVMMTSDLSGWTQKYIEDRFPGAVALWAVSAGGDQAPLFTSRSRLRGEIHDEGSAGWAVLDVESRLLGAEIVRVANAIQSTSGQVVLWVTRSSVTCPAQQRTPQAGGPGGQPSGQEGPGGPQTGGQGGPGGRGQAQDQGQQGREGQSGVPGQVQIPRRVSDGSPMMIPLQLLMVNDIAIAGINGDPATEIGIEAKQDSLFDRTMMVTLIPNKIGHLNSDKQGCTNQAIDNEFQKMMKSYLPVWKAAQ
jgi:hypothetical protein